MHGIADVEVVSLPDGLVREALDLTSERGDSLNWLHWENSRLSQRRGSSDIQRKTHQRCEIMCVIIVGLEAFLDVRVTQLVRALEQCTARELGVLIWAVGKGVDQKEVRLNGLHGELGGLPDARMLVEESQLVSSLVGLNQLDIGVAMRNMFVEVIVGLTARIDRA